MAHSFPTRRSSDLVDLPEVEAQCRRIITGSLLRNDIDAIVDGIHLSLVTPLGAHLDNTTLANIEPERRLAELNFEMSVADLANGVRVSDFGRILDDLVPGQDTLRSYVEMLKHESFDIALAGLVNGSIDEIGRASCRERVCHNV